MPRAVAIAATTKALCSAWELDSTSFAWDNRWGMPLEAAAVGAFAGDDVMRPPTSAIFQQARRWWRLHPFIQRMTQIRLAFILHGVLGDRERPQDPKDPDGDWETEYHPGIQALQRKDRDKLKAWKETNAAEIQRLVLEVGKERLITGNVVAIWQPEGRILVKPPEQCSYTDEFGTEMLTIKIDLTEEKIKKLNISPAAKAELLKSPRSLNLTKKSTVFKFSVLKDEAIGMGFGWPDLVTLFHVCSLDESLLVGDRQLADACRTVYEQHKLGHEIRTGNHAGSPAHFANKTRREGTLKEVKGSKGHKILVTNFDHDILMGAGRPDSKHWDALRYKGVAEHMAMWAMPYAQMLSGQINPFLMTLAHRDCAPHRERMGPYVAQLLREGMGCPVPVRIRFDDECFWDSRMLLDLLKTGLAGGPISQGTFLHKAGFHQGEELLAKQYEAKLNPAWTRPAYDAAHGPDQAPGKPAGKNDKE